MFKREAFSISLGEKYANIRYVFKTLNDFRVSGGATG